MDPYLFYDRLPKIIERLLNEMTFSMIYSVYATILYIWYSLTEKIFKRNSLEKHDESTQLMEQYMKNKRHPSKGQFPKIILYFKHLGLPKAVIFYSVQIFSSSLKNYKRSSYLVLLQTATIIELAIMILLIIEFLLMSSFLNTILNEGLKQQNEKKNNMKKKLMKDFQKGKENKDNKKSDDEEEDGEEERDDENEEE